MGYWEPITELVKGVENGSTSAVSLVGRSFSQIEAKKDYDAILLELKSNALDRAKKIDELVKTGKNPGILAGVPFIAKDNFLVFGGETTAGSNILKGFIAPYQATAINRLEEEGAICVAKANLDAFAHGGSTENSDFKVTKNPYDITRVSGGSSGGSAAAVALGMAPFALGTDTGGSIRQPSALCGVFGYKPTYGLVSRSGVIAMGSSLDCIGPITNCAEDAAIVLNVMAGRDELDSTTIDRDEQNYDCDSLDLRGAKIGVVKEYIGKDVNGEVRRATIDKIESLKKAGAIVTEVSLPALEYALACYYIICPAEVSSNLSRYDGQRFGFSYKDAPDLYSSYVSSRGIGFGKEAKRRIMTGTFVLSSGYYDAYYKKAMAVRTKIINEFDEAFKSVDFLVGPVTPTTAFKIGEMTKNPLDMYLEDIMTVAANLTGIPSAAIPIGVDSNNLPIGLQVMAPRRQDRKLLSLARSIEELNS